jgi:predicted RNA-binding protein with EMAP domain
MISNVNLLERAITVVNNDLEVRGGLSSGSGSASSRKLYGHYL